LSDEIVWGLVDAAPDGILVVDESGTVLLVNDQAERMFGYDRAELLGRVVDDLLPEGLRQVHRAHRLRYRAEPHTRPMGKGLELRGRRADGTEFPVEISLSPLTEAGRLFIVAAVRDITDRVRSDAQARRIGAMLDATHDAIFVFDGSLRFVHVNEGATRQLGYSRDELLAMTPLHIAPELTEHGLRELLSPLESGRIESTTVRTVHRRRDGVDLPVEAVLQRVGRPGDGDGPAYVAVVRDITERLEAEERLQLAREELHLLEDRERIARDLHDIVIQQLFAAGMTLQGTWSRIDQPEVAERIAGVVDDLDRTIREIRSVVFGLQASVVAPGGTRGKILGLVAEERTVLGFEPRIRFEGAIEGIDGDVVADLLATLREVLSNVARHAHATAADVTVTAGDEVVLRVRDNGVGIAASPPRGSGLGNIAARAARLGGSSEVRRAAEGGTLVEWRVPARPTT
jgi:PAS domain S-box-containing protein